MSLYSPEIRAALREGAVCWPLGVSFYFASGARHIWQGAHGLDAASFGGPLFEAVGPVGRITEAIEIGTSAASKALSFELSGLDEKFWALAADQDGEVWGRKVTIWELPHIGCPQWRLAGAIRRRTLVMDRIIRNAKRGDGGHVISLALSCEDPLVRRNVAANTFLTHADQQRRFPGDRACERVELLVQKRIGVFSG